MSDFLNEFLPDLEEFRDKTMKFHNGEIKVPEYKGFLVALEVMRNEAPKLIC